jgi:site-specific DNA-methyltransferase (adenine-specific)
LYNDIKNKIFCGNSLEVLKEFPSNSIDLVVTSPPYYNLRNYQHKDQIGSERTPDQYINNLISIFRECKRVLKKTGSIWVNIADSYLPNKSLIGVPERFVIAMQDELGLIRRNNIIWYKRSCMPSSTKDRFTIDFEYFYFFVKDPDSYYFETQYEPYAESTLLEIQKAYKGKGTKDYKGNGVQDPSEIKRRIIESFEKRKFGGSKETGKYASNQDSVTNATYSGNPYKIKINHTRSENSKSLQEAEKGMHNNTLHKQNYYELDLQGRIKRCVWDINTGNSKEHHFATYPEELIETPIKACTKTGDLVLDPFLGSGTTAIKSQKLGRNYVGIELNPKYVSIAKTRLNNMISSYLLRE